jgi:hypothetical protein
MIADRRREALDFVLGMAGVSKVQDVGLPLFENI